VRYAQPTIEPVRIITLFIASMCPSVMYSSRCNIFLVSTSSVCTIAKPEKMAPATKYGGKIVVCQPGITDVAKSKDTIVCTESTSGVDKPANTNASASWRCQFLADPVQPKEPIPYNNLRSLVLARSRIVAKSGIKPEYQNNNDTVK